MEDVTIAEFEKSKTETIVIRLAEFHDRHFLDVRAFYRINDGTLAPTKKRRGNPADQGGPRD